MTQIQRSVFAGEVERVSVFILFSADGEHVAEEGCSIAVIS
jgi:hypothetical protein